MPGILMVRTWRPVTPGGRAPSLRPEGIGLAPTRAGVKCASAALAGGWTSAVFRPRFGAGARARLFASPGHALDRDGPPLAVVGCAALDAFARRRGVCGDFGAQGRDMFAPTLRRGRRRGRAPWRGVPLEPMFAPARSAIRPARHGSLGATSLALPAAPGSRPFA